MACGVARVAALVAVGVWVSSTQVHAQSLQEVVTETLQTNPDVALSVAAPV